LAEPLEYLLTSPNTPAEAKKKTRIIEEIADAAAALLRSEGLSGVPGAELEAHAYAVNDRITDGEVRNLHILAAV
jgi:hypothetical protein